MGKRANGEGSVFRRADGKWTAEVSYWDDEGKRKRRTVYGATQAEVRVKQKALRERLASGAPMQVVTTTVGAWLEAWTSTSLPASGRRQATIDLYRGMVKLHLIPTLGRTRLDRLRPSDVEALVAAKRAEGLSPSTVRIVYTVLRAALDIAVRDGLLQQNPASAVRRPGIERRDTTYLTVEDAHRLLVAIKGERLEALFRVMLATGLRRGEALGLHWTEVDLDRGTLRVRWTLTRTSAGLRLGEPKTDLSRRTLPLPLTAIEVLRAHREAQATEAATAGAAWCDQGLVFTTEIGTALEPRNVLRRFQTITRRIGLEHAHLHTLRHSTASFLLAAGVHIKVVQELLGHSSYGITADVYSHIAPQLRREAADGIDSALKW